MSHPHSATLCDPENGNVTQRDRKGLCRDPALRYLTHLTKLIEQTLCPKPCPGVSPLVTTYVLGTNTEAHTLLTADSHACQRHKTLTEAEPGSSLVPVSNGRDTQVSLGLSNGTWALARIKGTGRR